MASGKRILLAAVTLAIAVDCAALNERATATQDQAQPSSARKMGTVKSISGNTIVLKADSGPDFTAQVQEGARILRLAPGQTDLKSATPMQLQEAQVGDRMLVRGKPGDSADVIVAASIIVMKQSDVSQKQQAELQDWQKRGVGGLVTAIDSSVGTITVAPTPANSFIVKTSKDTNFLRYAPGSIKFSDAQKSTFDQIKVGDQLRARGNKTTDGKEVAAEAVISGSFRNIAGTVSSLDAAANAVTVKDILGKKTVVVKLTADSQMRQLPAQMAQRIAFVLKGPAGGTGNGAAATGAPGGNPGGGAPGGGQRPGGTPDFQQIVSRLPAVTLADLHKDDAVMIVATPGTGGSEVVAIMLLSGVEPILTASPNGAAALLSGWNLSAPGGDAGPQ
jgi:hypothetical protein